jgi:Kdo2-lipid IVA lauroyltransferase/acyltransferase
VTGSRGPARPSPGHRVEFVAFRTMRWIASTVPESWAMRVGAALGRMAGSVLRIRRGDVDRHLAWAFPDRTPAERARLARRSYEHLGREAMVLFRFGGWTKEHLFDRVEIEGLDELVTCLEEHHGAIVLTGHLGNWEVGGAAVAARGIPVDGIAKGMANRRFERELFATRARLGVRVIEMSEAPSAVLRSLRGGRVVAIVGDQNAHRNGVFVPCFGRLAATARGPAMFALRTGVPVFVGFAVRKPGSRQRYTLTLEPLLYEVTGDLQADVTAFTAAYMAKVEAAVRRHPEQYFWHHKRWKTRPPQEPPPHP